MKKTTTLIAGIVSLVLISGSAVYALGSDQVPGQSAKNDILDVTAGKATQDVTPTSPTMQDITAQSIKDKMLNAIDNYQSVKGPYHTILKPIQEDQTFYFEVREGDQPSSYTKIKNNNTGNEQEFKANGTEFLLLNHYNKSYRKTHTENIQQAKLNGPRTFKDNEGRNVLVSRHDPAFAQANDISFPQKYAFWLDDQDKNYKLIGTETILGRQAAIIEGHHLDPLLAEKHQADTFKMWIDINTGVLLKLIETNNLNEVTNSLEMLSLQFDGSIDDMVFDTSVPSAEWTDQDARKQK